MSNYVRKETTKNGGIYYYNDKNELHRIDGPAIEGSNGDKYWCVNGKYHRLDGPAVELVDGGKAWYVNGMLHRDDGPAVEHANGGKDWYVNGKEFTEEEFNKHPLVVECRLGKIISEVLSE